MATTYEVIDIIDTYVESYSIISVTKVKALLRNTENNKTMYAVVTFFQLIDLYDMERNGKFTTCSKIKVESLY